MSLTALTALVLATMVVLIAVAGYVLSQTFLLSAARHLAVTQGLRPIEFLPHWTRPVSSGAGLLLTWVLFHPLTALV